MKTVSGKALPALGMFTTALDIANGSYSCIFLVVQDVPYDAVLGRDFLRENEAIINLKESTLRLDGKGEEPYPERKLVQGLTCDQSPVQPSRRKEFIEEHSATEKTPIKQGRASRKRALPPAFIGTLFFPSASGETNVPKESYRRFQLIPTTRHSEKTNVSRLLIRQSFLTTLCIALYLLTATHATVPNQNVYKLQMTSQIFAVQKQTFDIRNVTGVPVQVCPTNPKEPYKIGQATSESKKMREPLQPVKQRNTKQFPPMTSSDAEFPDRTVYEVPRGNSTLKHQFLSQERSHVNPLHAPRHEHCSERDTRNAYSTVTPKELYFRPDRSVLSICVPKQ